MKRFTILLLALVAIFASNISISNAASLSGDQMANEILGKQPKTFDSKTAQSGPKGNQMASEILGSQKTTQVAAPQISEKGIADRVFKKLSTLLTGKDSETAKAVTGLKTEIQKKDSETAKAVAESGDKAIEESNSNAYLLLVALAIGFIGLGVLIYFRTKRIEKKVADVPAATNKLVKKLDPFTFSFESRGHQVTCTPSIDGGAYNSFHVPTSVKSKVADPSKIKRSPTTSQGELRRDTLNLLSDFFDGKFNKTDTHSVLQRELISYVQKTGELVIA